jgi:hypothetical protein
MGMRACVACGTDYSEDCIVCRTPNRARCPQPRGPSHPHVLQWGDAYASFIVCVKCRMGWESTATILDLLTECLGRSVLT